MPELKPCPLCGSEAHYHTCGGVAAYGCGEYVGEIECTKCGLLFDTSSCETPEEAERDAVKAWNTRVSQ